jgi:hypothetical protein
MTVLPYYSRSKRQGACGRLYMCRLGHIARTTFQQVLKPTLKSLSKPTSDCHNGESLTQAGIRAVPSIAAARVAVMQYCKLGKTKARLANDG